MCDAFSRMENKTTFTVIAVLVGVAVGLLVSGWYDISNNSAVPPVFPKLTWP